MVENFQLSVIVTTRNEEENIANCLAAFQNFRETHEVETIVVDHDSHDRTLEIAKNFGARVFSQGPERSAQRNRGAHEARADFLLFLDADMIVANETIREILTRINEASVDALYIREIRTGSGIRTKARNFERSFYDATCIDVVRVVRRKLFFDVGGFDETLTGPEDWDFERRLREKTNKCFLTDCSLLHNEKNLPLSRVLEKKAYYTKCFARYQEKWHHDQIIRKQFGFYYRFIGVFVEKGKWKKILRHPILFCVMMFERVLVGFVYLAKKGKLK